MLTKGLIGGFKIDCTSAFTVGTGIRQPLSRASQNITIDIDGDHTYGQWIKTLTEAKVRMPMGGRS